VFHFSNPLQEICKLEQITAVIECFNIYKQLISQEKYSENWNQISYPCSINAVYMTATG